MVEVLSASTRRHDLGEKRVAYRTSSVSEYWVIDRFERRALVWRGGSGASDLGAGDVLRWRPRADLPELEIALEAVLG